VGGLAVGGGGARVDFGIDVVAIVVVEAALADLVKRLKHFALFVDDGGLVVAHDEGVDVGRPCAE